MRPKRTGVLTLLFLTLLASAATAETVSLSIDEAVQRALDASINLQKNAVDLAQAGYSADRLWAEIFPSFSLSAGMTILPTTPLFTDPGFEYNSDQLSYNFNLGVSISLNPSASASMKRIELAYRTQLLNYESAARQLEIQIVKNYLNLINRQENISFLKDRLELALQRMENDRIAWENGHMNELTWLDSLLNVETARFNLSNTLGAYEIALDDFLVLLGMEAGTGVILSEDLEITRLDFNPERLILNHLAARPDIVRQRQTIERLELTKNITGLSSRAPTLTLSTDWGGRSRPQTGEPRRGLRDPIGDNISGSISLRIPIDSWIPGTRQNQSIRAANAEVEKARLDLRNLETSAQTQIRSLVQNIRNTWESIEIARLRVTIAERTVEITEEGFRNGTINFEDREEIRNDLGDYRQRLRQTELTYKNHLLDLAAALNVDWKTIIN